MEDKTKDIVFEVLEMMHINSLRLSIPVFEQNIDEAKAKHLESVEEQKRLASNVNDSKWYNRWWHYLRLKREVRKDMFRCGEIYRLTELVTENKKKVEEYDKRREAQGKKI